MLYIDTHPPLNFPAFAKDFQYARLDFYTSLIRSFKETFVTG